MTEVYLQMIVALAVVIGLVVMIGVYMRRKQASPALMQVVAYQSFGPRKGMAVLKVGREVFLVGVTATDIKLLKSLNAADLEDEATREITDKIRRLKRIKGEIRERQ
jgi:flagellar biogenesis protein FliO